MDVFRVLRARGVCLFQYETQKNKLLTGLSAKIFLKRAAEGDAAATTAVAERAPSQADLRHQEISGNNLLAVSTP